MFALHLTRIVIAIPINNVFIGIVKLAILLPSHSHTSQCTSMTLSTCSDDDVHMQCAAP